MMAKFGLHLPLHRQSQRFAHEGVPIDVLTLAGWVGAVTTALSSLVTRIEAHVRGAERLHLDAPLPVLAKGKTHTGRLWTMMRDDRPFGGPEPPAAAYFYSPDCPDAHAVTCDPADRGGPPQLDYRRLGYRRSSRGRLSTLIKTAKLNGIDAQVCLADVLGRLPDYPALRINDLLPWNWTQHQPRPIAA